MDLNEILEKYVESINIYCDLKFSDKKEDKKEDIKEVENKLSEISKYLETNFPNEKDMLDMEIPNEIFYKLSKINKVMALFGIGLTIKEIEV